MLEDGGVKRYLPGITTITEGVNIYYAFGNYKEKEDEFGAIGFRLNPRANV